MQKEWQNKTEWLYYFFLLPLIGFSLPFAAPINSWVITFSFIFWWTLPGLKHRCIKTVKHPITILFWSLFLLHIISYFISANSSEAFHILTRRASYFIFPLLVIGSTIDARIIKRTLLFFVSGVLLALLICYINGIAMYLKTSDSAYLFYHQFTLIISIHAVYMAAYVLFSICILLYYSKEFNKLFLYILIAFFCLSLILLNSKLMFFLLLLLGVLYFFYKYRSRKAYIYSFLFIVCFCISVFFVPKVKQRFNHELSSNFNVLSQTSFVYNTHFTGTSLRLLIWKLSVKIINENNAWLYGIGIGDMQDMLNLKYKEIGIYTGNPQLRDIGYLGYNPHNQYFEFLLSMGISALLVFILLLFISMHYAYKNNNYLWLSFFIIFFLFCVTESVLSTHKGIVFFCFFSALFLKDFRLKINR